AEVAELQGVRTQGRSIETVRRRVPEAIEAAGESGPYELERRFNLSEESLDAKLATIRKLYAQARRNEEEAQEMRRAVARVLTKKMSLRDAGAVLGVTGARVQQLIQRK